MIHHQHHHHFLRRHLSSVDWRQAALRRLYAASFLHDLGLQMLSLFILFYLYERGWSLIFVVAYILAFTLLAPLGKRLSIALIGKFGVPKTMLLSNVLRLLFTGALFALGAPSALGYALLALIVGLDSLSFRIYYTAWDFYFAGLEKREQSGRQTAFAWILIAASAAIAPLIGGLLAQYWGFKASIIVASILLLFSVVPLIVVKHHKSPVDAQKLRRAMTFQRYWQIFKDTPKGGLLAFSASNLIFNIFLPLWTLYLAVVIFVDKTYSGLGILFAVSSLVALLVSLVVGRLIDRGHYKPVLRVSGWLEFLLGGMRFFVVGIPTAVAHNFVHQQGWAHNLTAFQWYYERESRPIERLVFFQMCSYFQSLIHVIIVIVILVCLWVFADSQLEVLKYTCIILGLSGPFMLALSLKRR